MSKPTHPQYDQLSTYFLSCGFFPVKVIVDSNIHRFKRDPGQKQNDCWYFATTYQSRDGEELLYCVFGDLKTGEKHHFNSRHESLNPKNYKQ